MPELPVPRRLIAALTACLLTFASATASAQEPTSDPSAGPTPATTGVPVTSPEGAWVVTAFDAYEQGLVEPLPDSLLRISLLTDGQLQGETACGRFIGGWSWSGSELFAGIAPTGFLGCAEEQTGEATGLNTAVAAVVAWQPADAGGIELLDAAGATRLVLQPLMAGDPAGTWKVTRFRRPNGEWTTPVPDSPMDLTLRPEGFLEGSTGCRLLLGGYTYDAGDITIGPFETEGLPCEGDVARAERWFLRALGETLTWERSDESLTLSDEDRPVAELTTAAEAAE